MNYLPWGYIFTPQTPALAAFSMTSGVMDGWSYVLIRGLTATGFRVGQTYEKRHEKVDARGQLPEFRLVLENLGGCQSLTGFPAAFPGNLHTRSTVVIGGTYGRLVNMGRVSQYLSYPGGGDEATYEIRHAITNR